MSNQTPPWPDGSNGHAPVPGGQPGPGEQGSREPWVGAQGAGEQWPNQGPNPTGQNPSGGSYPGQQTPNGWGTSSNGWGQPPQGQSPQNQSFQGQSFQQPQWGQQPPFQGFGAQYPHQGTHPAWATPNQPGQNPYAGAGWQSASGGWQTGAGSLGAPGFDGQAGFGAPGAPRHDPHAPLGGHVPAAVGIDQFQQKRSRRPLIITLAVLLAVAIAAILGVRAINRPSVAPTSAPSATHSATPVPSGTTAGRSVPFENTTDNASGTWTITKSQWDGEQLTVTMTVQVAKGTQPLGFFAITNDSDTQTYAAAASGRSDDLLGKQVSAGQTVTGTVSFRMPDKESTIFITDSRDRQVTALIVPA